MSDPRPTGWARGDDRRARWLLLVGAVLVVDAIDDARLVAWELEMLRRAW